MQTINPGRVTALAEMCIAALMVHAGVSKHQLAGRTGRVKRDGRRKS
jgi:hypothetical protein